MNSKSVFLFGAGAEYGKESFNLPSGSDYTYQTMQLRYEKLYRELRKFYANRLQDNFVKEYRSAFLFERDSHTFREIIYRAAIQYRKENTSKCAVPVFDEYLQLVEQCETERKKSGKQISKDLSDAVKGQAKLVYDELIKNGDESLIIQNGSPDGAKTLKDYLSFYGAVEKDFSAIIHPNQVGLTQFWRVVNYYWSAFFVILLPLCEDFNWYKEMGGEKTAVFRYVLNHMEDVIHMICSEYDYDKVDMRSGNYYKEISESFPDCTAVTTNYTPFIEHYFDKNAYLAGRLAEFEFPLEFSVKNLNSYPLGEKDFVFPFLMTQAPIKPIIVPNQIREYEKTLNALDDADNLIIIGYSLGETDNHINAIIREFVKKKEKRIVYCYYDGSSKKSEADERHAVLRALRLGNDTENIDVMKNNGNAKDLVNRLKKII